MQWTGLGKVSVPSAGTPVALASGAQIKVNTLMITYDPADGAATILIKDGTGNTIAAMASATAQPIVFTAPQGNPLNLANFQVDSGTSGKGPFVGYGVS